MLRVLDLAGRLLVAGAFGWAAAGKLADLPRLRAALYLSRLTRPWVPQVSVLLPATELVLAAGLTGARSGWASAAASGVLLVAFTGYLALDPSAARGCHCFGGRTATSRRAGILRNVVLLAVLVPAVARGPSAGRWGVPAAAEPWAGAVAAIGVLLGTWWAFHRDGAARSSGRRRAGVPPVPAPQARREAVPFDVPSLAGGRLRLADLAARPEGVLLVFVEPGCGLCEALLPAAAGRADVAVLVAVDDPAQAAGWAADHGLAPSAVGIDLAGAVADAYRVPAVPAATRVDVRGLLLGATGTPTARPAVGPDAVRRLLEP